MDLVARFVGALPDTDPALVQAAGVDLLARWDEPHRRYHTRAHLAGMLDTLGPDAAADLLLATWFHDAVYDPRAPDNEERSAALAVTVLTGLGYDPAEVRRLVLLTRSHDPVPGDLAGELLCDADLAILASPPHEYSDYTRAVREEYAHVPDEAFQIGRSAILASLLDLPRLFHQHPEWEAAARGNLSAELRQLSGGEDLPL